jgi:hypothetical protein
VSPPGALNAKMTNAKCLMRNDSAAFAENCVLVGENLVDLFPCPLSAEFIDGEAGILDDLGHRERVDRIVARGS